MTKSLRALVALGALGALAAGHRAAYAQDTAAPPPATPEPAPAAPAPAAPADTTAPAAGSAAPAAEEKPAGAQSVAEQKALTTEKHEAAAPVVTTDTPAPDHREQGEDDDYGHMLQAGLRASIVLGYNINFRYQHSPLCTPYKTEEDTDGVYGSGWDEQQKICGYGAPPAVDVALSFAPLDGIEPFFFGRFGFSGEEQTNTKPLRLIGLGARVYTMADSRFKIFIEPAIGYQFEEGAGNVAWSPGKLDPQYKKDLVFHVGIGPQYDFSRGFGLFGGLGMDVGVLRAISARLYGQVGLQIRMP